jgi:hypothetical protein
MRRNASHDIVWQGQRQVLSATAVLQGAAAALPGHGPYFYDKIWRVKRFFQKKRAAHRRSRRATTLPADDRLVLDRIPPVTGATYSSGSAVRPLSIRRPVIRPQRRTAR